MSDPMNLTPRERAEFLMRNAKHSREEAERLEAHILDLVAQGIAAGDKRMTAPTAGPAPLPWEFVKCGEAFPGDGLLWMPYTMDVVRTVFGHKAHRDCWYLPFSFFRSNPPHQPTPGESND